MVDLLEVSSNQPQNLIYIRAKALEIISKQVSVKTVALNGSLPIVSVDSYPPHTHDSEYR